MTPDFRLRPTAQEAVHQWTQIIRKVGNSMARWRLPKRDESFSERVVLDTMDVAREGLRNVARLLNRDVSPARII